MAKEWMIEALGERQLLLPGLVRRALAANDRAKYLLTLLQTARAAADGIDGVTSLREERIASGIGTTSTAAAAPTVPNREYDQLDGSGLRQTGEPLWSAYSTNSIITGEPGASAKAIRNRPDTPVSAS